MAVISEITDAYVSSPSSVTVMFKTTFADASEFKRYTKSYSVTGQIKRVPLINRNAPCPCKSGRKFKVCCMNK